MKIGIIESEHFETVYPLIRLLDDGNNELFLFVNETTSEQLKIALGSSYESRYHWVIQQNKLSTRKFLNQVQSSIKKNGISFLILNTVSKHHLFYAWMIHLSGRIKTLLTVHDTNELFRNSLGWQPRNWIRFAGRQWLLNKVQYLNTINETVLPYLQQKARPYHTVVQLPAAVFEGDHHCPPVHDSIRLVICGSIDPKRRDYQQVVKLLKFTNNLPLQVILLGSARGSYAKEIIESANSQKENSVISFEDEIIPQPEFDNVIRNSHFIWMPVNVHTVSPTGIPEVYGITKSSGNIGDVIRQGKPFIVPQELAIPGNLANSCFRYENLEALADFLRALMEDPDRYPEYCKAANQASMEYSVKQIREKKLAFIYRD
jgi:hypothetical protein